MERRDEREGGRESTLASLLGIVGGIIGRSRSVGRSAAGRKGERENDGPPRPKMIDRPFELRAHHQSGDRREEGSEERRAEVFRAMLHTSTLTCMAAKCEAQCKIQSNPTAECEAPRNSKSLLASRIAKK